MSDAGAFDHVPVLLDRVVELLDAAPPGWIVDATLGGGGHAAALLDASDAHCVLGLDQDDRAVAAAGERLAPHGDRVRIRRARFDELEHEVAALVASGGGPVTGVLFDLGVSSPQLDEGERGFSYRVDAPLDMRMDRRRERTAAQLVNDTDERELAGILRRGGEDRFERRIARAIVAARPIDGTARLAQVVADAVPAPARRSGHPARRTFQALRIAVNDELDILAGSIDQAIAALAPLGRCVVLAYHSGEDRIVKERFRNAETGGCECPPGLPCVCGAKPVARLLGRRAQKASAEEIERNHRAESVRLRALEILEPTTGDETSRSAA